MSDTKYAIALQLMDAVVAAKGDEDVVPAWDTLFAFVHSNFEAPVDACQLSNLVNCKEMMRNADGQFERNLRADPPVLSETMFPVAVFRYLVKVASILIDPKKLATFDEYFQRYGQMVLKSTDLTG